MSSVEKFLKFLIIFFPFLFVSGPFLPDLACVIIGLFYIFYVIKEKNFSDFKSNIIIFLLFFLLYININSTLSFDPIISLKSTLPYLRIILFILGLAYIVNKYTNVTSLFFYSSLICYLFLFIDSSFQFLIGKNLIGIELKNNSRISSFFGDEHIMGSFVSRLLPILLGLSYLIKDNNYIKHLRFFLILISLFLVIYSGERLASIYFLITLLLYFYFDFDKKKIIIFFIILGSIFLLFPKQHNTFINRIFVHSYNQFKETDSILKFSYRHYLHYYTAYKMYSDRKLLGQGVKSFRYLCDLNKFSAHEKIINDNKIIAEEDSLVFFTENLNHLFVNFTNDSTFNIEKIIKKYQIPKQDVLKFHIKNKTKVKKGDPIISFYEFKDGCNTHPHNFYMQFLSELGILGIMFLIIAFVFSFLNLMKIMFKKLNRKITTIEHFNAFFYVGIFINLFPFLPSGNFFNNWLLLLVHLPLGIYIALNKNSLSYFK
ncbi:O-antigen ligase family protein [Candidatus Pelagibacter sp.]|nr:O-antigen ligase family protein [Candidatus Pelagibacter sp.]